MNAEIEMNGPDGLDALDKLAAEIGYSDGADGDEGGVDALIDYKNALEDRCRRVEGERDRVEAALTQCQHISHDGLVEIERSVFKDFDRLRRAVAMLEKIQSISEGGAADPEFVAMLTAADSEPTVAERGDEAEL